MTGDVNLQKLSSDYEECGWVVTKLPDFNSVVSVRDELRQYLRQLIGNPNVSLEDYHSFVDQDDHGKIQLAMARYFWEGQLCLALAQGQISLLKAFIGSDLHIQQRAYLRIARPGVREDNIGFHRDTFYGQSPYEVAIHVPLVDLTTDACMQFLSGSHVLSESKFSIIAEGDADWRKGSPKHELGFPYSPKNIVPESSSMAAIPVAFGEAIIFAPSIVHGQELNGGDISRFSIDFRVVNSYAPIKIREEKSSRGYIPLVSSPVAKVAQRYLAACEQEDN